MARRGEMAASSQAPAPGAVPLNSKSTKATSASGKEQVNSANTQLHCVRCHGHFTASNPEGCIIRAGRDSTMASIGGRVVQICHQCDPEHVVDDKPLCFSGQHTTKLEEVTFEEPNTDHPDYDPEPEICDVCQAYIWE